MLLLLKGIMEGNVHIARLPSLLSGAGEEDLTTLVTKVREMP